MVLYLDVPMMFIVARRSHFQLASPFLQIALLLVCDVDHFCLPVTVKTGYYFGLNIICSDADGVSFVGDMQNMTIGTAYRDLGL